MGVALTIETISAPHRQSLAALQGLRGVAALLVVADHTLLTGIRRLGLTQSAEPYAYLLGALGVQTFFAISGFVMVLSHGQDFAKAGAPGYFATRRLCRIVPLYWVTTLIYWAKEQAQGHAVALHFLLLSLFFIPHQEPGMAFGRPVFPIGWTLIYEMAFYLVFTVALVFRRWIGAALIFAVFVSLCLFSALTPRAHPVWHFLGSPIVLFFLAGMATGWLRRALATVPRWGFATAACGSAALLLGAIPAMAWSLAADTPAAWIPIVPCLGAILLCGLADERIDAAAPVPRIARTLGDATYSIYLTHGFVVGGAATVLARLGLGFAAMAVLSAPAAIVVGILTYRRVERPLVRAASALMRRMFGASVAQPPRG